MKMKQCQRIALRLLSGKTVTKKWGMQNYIGSLHSRIRVLNGWICEQEPLGGRNLGYFFDPWAIGSYIKNLNPKNVCATYELPKRYAKYLKAALNKRGMI